MSKFRYVLLRKQLFHNLQKSVIVEMILVEFVQLFTTEKLAENFEELQVFRNIFQ